MPRFPAASPACRPAVTLGLVLALAWLGVAWAAPAVAAEAPDVQAIMRRIDRLWRGDTSHAVMTMVVRTRHYERNMTMEAWSRGKDESLVQIEAPVKDRGVATLKVGQNIWNYFPKINRVTKVPPSMMMGSWMGSHFTNDDLVKESSYEEDYTYELTFHGRREGRAVYEVTLTPRPEAAVVWGKVTMEVTQDALMPLEFRYFDEDGRLVRRMTFDDPRRFGDRTVPARLVMRPEDKPEESTTVIYEELTFDVKLPPDLFSLRSLRQGR